MTATATVYRTRPKAAAAFARRTLLVVSRRRRWGSAEQAPACVLTGSPASARVRSPRRSGTVPRRSTTTVMAHRTISETRPARVIRARSLRIARTRTRTWGAAERLDGLVWGPRQTICPATGRNASGAWARGRPTAGPPKTTTATANPITRASAASARPAPPRPAARRCALGRESVCRWTIGGGRTGAAASCLTLGALRSASRVWEYLETSGVPRYRMTLALSSSGAERRKISTWPAAPIAALLSRLQPPSLPSTAAVMKGPRS